MSLLIDVRDLAIAAASVGARFVGETMIAWADSADEMLSGFSEYEAGDYLSAQTPAATTDAAEGPSADSDIPPSPAEGRPTCLKLDVCKNCDKPIELYTDRMPNNSLASVWLHKLDNGLTRVACSTNGALVVPTYATPK